MTKLALISLPTDFNANITANAGSIISDLGDYTALIIGILLGVLVIGILINAIKK